MKMDREETERKPYIEHDPVVGFRYIPKTKMALLAPDGRRYEVCVNSAGIRADREYARKKPNGVYRLLVCGDSLTAGQYVENDLRFTERLESFFPNTEFINLGLEGSGTDQQYLLFKEFASRYEYDAVLLCPYLENIRRNLVRYRLSVDLKSKRWVLTPKPRLVLGSDDNWIWEGIPVSDERPFFDEASAELVAITDFGGATVNPRWVDRLKGSISRTLERTRTKGILYRIIQHEPYRDYKDPTSPGWQTMKAILSSFRQIAGNKKFIVAPLMPISHLLYDLSPAYRLRFSEECELFADILPHLKRLTRDNYHECYIPNDAHFSKFGHEQVAHALKSELLRLKVLTESS